MMVKIKCPKCAAEGSLSLAESNYQGPYRCWKCRRLFTIKLEKNELQSCEPLSQKEFEKLQEMKKKFDIFTNPTSNYVLRKFIWEYFQWDSLF